MSSQTVVIVGDTEGIVKQLLSYFVLLISVLTLSCGEDVEPEWADGDEGLERDILHTSLAVDLSSLTATATIEVAAADSPYVSFEAGGLDITSVRNRSGALDFRVESGRLDVILNDASNSIEVGYGFQTRSGFDGLGERGATALWPYYCGNVFPCHSDPADGVQFALELSGIPDDQMAVYPASIPADAPSYQLAWTVDDYVEIELGQTAAGTFISVWHLPGSADRAAEGTRRLLSVFDWYESTLGPYLYGDRAGSVEVDWGPTFYGGTEHHPYWHISSESMGDTVVHAHEAAHGWYGNGVRLRCWEDFVLSEGTVTYLTARALGDVGGELLESRIWEIYERSIEYLVASEDAVAWPQSCGLADPVESFSDVPYMKGAFFYRAVADEIGVDELDEVLSAFYLERQGTAAGMQDMIDFIFDETGFDPTDLANGWLRSLGRPD